MSNENNDVIQMNTNTTIKDSNGQPINVTVPQPEYIKETFDRHSINSGAKSSTGDDE